MTSKEYDFLLKDPVGDSTQKATKKVYKVLIVDDEEDVHVMTRLSLKDLTYKGIPIEFISAYGEKDTKEIISSVNDIATIILDVVMEHEDSGLRLVEYIRNELLNHQVRIILRTGQPGVALEEEVIVDYDINDYKDKAELTRKKLFSAVFSSIRSYNDIMKLENTQNGLKKIIESTSNFFDIQENTFQEFVVSLIDNLEKICKSTGNLGDRNDSFFIFMDNGKKSTITASGDFSYMIGMNTDEIDYVIEKMGLSNMVNNERDIYAEITDRGDLFFMHRSVMDRVSIYYQSLNDIDTEIDLFKLYLMNCVVGIDNYFVKKDIYDSQLESLYMLSDTIEQRSTNTANHIKRVSEQVQLLGEAYHYNAAEIRNLKFASMLHDIGKIGVPDDILLKPGKLSDEEFTEMKKHTQIGHKLLNQSKLPIMKMAAEIALYHHENWDGTGYPEGLKDKEIPFSARVVGLLDVFDALVTKRVYKEPWSFEEAFEFVLSQSEIKFDPELVETYKSLYNEIQDIYSKFPQSDM